MEEFDSGLIEQVGEIMSSCCSHHELGNVFSQCRFDAETESLGLSKPKRIAHVLQHEQKKSCSGNVVLRFIKECLSKSRFVNDPVGFEDHRVDLNKVLILAGIEYRKDCEFAKVEPAKTLDEVAARVASLLAKLRDRNCHNEVLKSCTREIVAEDDFHAVFEAAKGVCQRVRDMTGLTADGANLVQRAFSSTSPMLAFNTLQTESELSEQKGILSLFLGACQFLRNPRAHAPRSIWRDETMTIDVLMFISMLHKILDHCVRVPSAV